MWTATTCWKPSAKLSIKVNEWGGNVQTAISPLFRDAPDKLGSPENAIAKTKPAATLSVLSTWETLGTCCLSRLPLSHAQGKDWLGFFF
jgi:hypothetical protein